MTRISETALIGRAKYQLGILKCPTGKYCFVGSGIPAELARDAISGHTRVWDTEAEIRQAAADAGLVVAQ